MLRTIRPGCSTAHPAQPRPSVASTKTRGPSASRPGGGTDCPGFSTSAQGMGTSPSAGSGGQALAHWLGPVPPLGSAVTQTLSSPPSERVPQAEESGFGPCVDGRASWSRCRSSRWRRTVPPARARALPCLELCRGSCCSAEGLQKWLLTTSFPFSQCDFFLCSANHFFHLRVTKGFFSNWITKQAGFLLPVVEILH